MTPWIVLALVACAADPAPAPAPTGAAPAASPRDEAHALVAAGARLVDVRTPAEFAGGHLDGAVNIPVDEVGRRSAEIGAKDAPVVVYCRSGGRSASAATTLRAQGFTKVVDLGAMSNW